MARGRPMKISNRQPKPPSELQPVNNPEQWNRCHPSESPERWEYMETKEPLPVRNRFGELGWKLVAATEDNYGKVTFHFCRRITQ